MSAWKIAIPAAFAGALLTIATYELGRRAGREERPAVTLVDPTPVTAPAPASAPAIATAPDVMAAPDAQPAPDAPHPPTPPPTKAAAPIDPQGDACRCAPAYAFDAVAKTCVPREQAKPCDPNVNGPPVAACDGHAYATACDAASQGAKQWSQLKPYAEEKPIPAGCLCPPGLALVADECQPANASAVAACAAQGKDPVCGCNRLTYPNECAAKASGVRKFTAGRCP